MDEGRIHAIRIKLAEAKKELDLAILLTPTGPIRVNLTEVNIRLIVAERLLGQVAKL